jgi:CBS domain-containing protein
MARDVKSNTVRHAMTRDVVSIAPGASLLEATRLMQRHHVSGLPVASADGHVQGVLSEKDVVRALGGDDPEGLLTLITQPERVATDRLQKMRSTLESAKVGDHMTPDPFTVGPETSIENAAQVLAERKINRVPVVEGGRLVGILTRHDVLAAL